MVDVGSKEVTERVAVASGRVHVGEEAFALVEANQLKKGDILTVATLAGKIAPVMHLSTCDVADAKIIVS